MSNTYVQLWRRILSFLPSVLLLFMVLSLGVYVWREHQHERTFWARFTKIVPTPTYLSDQIEPLLAESTFPISRQKWPGSEFPYEDLFDLDVLEGMPKLEDGKWIVVNRPSYKLSPECRRINKHMLPEVTSDLRYVLVVDPENRLSVGRYGYQGSSASVEMFVSEYTIHLIDWRKKRILWKEILRSPKNPGNWGIIKKWHENQTKPRRTILYWMSAFGLVSKPYWA